MAKWIPHYSPQVFCGCSVTKSWLTLCDPMTPSTPGFPVLHYLPDWLKLMAIELVMPPRHFILCHPLLLPSRSFPMSRLFTTGDQNIGASASASVLPMNIQDWFPLGWTGWISLQSKGLSRVFSNSTIQKHQFFGISLLYGPNFTWYMTAEKP